jgi:hypothetical protein
MAPKATALSEAAPMNRKLSLRASRCKTKKMKAQTRAALAPRGIAVVLSAVDTASDRNRYMIAAPKKALRHHKSRAFFAAHALRADSP